MINLNDKIIVQENDGLIFLTGVAGFIGFHLAKRLLDCSYQIIGIDNLNDYYDIRLKKTRLNILNKYDNFSFYKIDLESRDLLDELMLFYRPKYFIHLAAQAGVRHSINSPHSYIDSNIVGFINVLEACRKFPIKHLIYASSSSVYGGNKSVPFSTSHNVDHPVSLYAATKKANELMAHSYSHLYNIPTTGLRFFTVYGPWGRPDMAYYSFTRDIIEGKPIKVFNHGRMERDFTYIDDIIEGIVKLIDKIPRPNPRWSENLNGINSSFAPYKIYNVGNSTPVPLMRFIMALETSIGKEANKIYLDMQLGDVHTTYADITDLENDIGFKPNTSIEKGIEKFIDWYKKYHNIT